MNKDQSNKFRKRALGYSHRDSKNKKTSNSRNGSYKKSVNTTTGKVDLNIPRDRDGSLEPKAVPKYEGVSQNSKNKSYLCMPKE